MTAIVRAALDSSRPPAIPHERADLGALVRRVCQMASPMLEDAGVQVEVMAPDQPLEILADPVQLELALLNLISNSVDAMASGGKLTVRLERVGRSAPSRGRRHRQRDSTRAAGSHLRPVGDHKSARQRIGLGAEHRPPSHRQPRGNDPRATIGRATEPSSRSTSPRRREIIRTSHIAHAENSRR